MKHHEFWHPRVFEAPYYLYLAWRCLRHGIGIRDLARANHALDHGEIGIGSKVATQLAFDQKYFLPTDLLVDSDPLATRLEKARGFAEEHGYPVILKPDTGCVGKGIARCATSDDLARTLPAYDGAVIIQTFTHYPVEYGIFYVRLGGISEISGMNRKHFPQVTGDGSRTLAELVACHPRRTDHWNLFLQYHDLSRVPDRDEDVVLSFVGSHTMGCMFTNDTAKVTPELERAIFAICDPQLGFNFGRLDVKASSEAALLSGDFVVIEVNGVASLPTHMFDPRLTLRESYRIFLYHARKLAAIAAEHRNEPMSLAPLREIIARVSANQSALDQSHQRILTRSPATGITGP